MQLPVASHDYLVRLVRLCIGFVSFVVQIHGPLVRACSPRKKAPSVNTAEERAKYCKRLQESDDEFNKHMVWVNEHEEASS